MGRPKKKIILLHGCGPKPAEGELHTLWREAMREGLHRDKPKLVAEFERVESDFVYSGDYSARFVRPEFDPELDIENRRQALRELVDLGKPREFRRRNYDALPGKSAAKEFLMDAGSSLGI